LGEVKFGLFQNTKTFMVVGRSQTTFEIKKNLAPSHKLFLEWPNLGFEVYEMLHC